VVYEKHLHEQVEGNKSQNTKDYAEGFHTFTIHKKLDEAVFAAYGWRSDLSDEEILEKLLAFA
jgi:hypothetical protein